MTGIDILLALTFICGFYVAWNIGANDVANAMGTSVGSGALTLRRAVLLAAVFEFSGAYFVGANVSETVRKKMFDPEQIVLLYGDDAYLILACGMIASLLAAGTWLLVATYLAWPVSTTHSIVGAVVGFGCVALGVEGIAWDKVVLISAGWLISPVISGVIAYLMFGMILKTVFHQQDPLAAAKRVTPRLVFVVVAVLSGVTTFKALKAFWKARGIDPFEPTFVIAVSVITAVIGVVAMLTSKRLLKRLDPKPGDQAVKLEHADHKGENNDQDAQSIRSVERVFVLLQVITACLVAFAHGSNDVANAIGPLSAAYQALTEGVISRTAVTPNWALILGGVGIVVGLATWGWRVIQTVGKKITELTPSRGFCAEFAAAITILVASTLPVGLPISTTHTLVGAVLGVGMARGINALNFRTMRDIVAGWAITIPAGAGLSVLFFFLLKAAFVSP